MDPEVLAAGCEVWRRSGFRVVHGEGIVAREGYLAGDDAHRARELTTLWQDPEVDAIVCARGGYGSARLISRLDARLVRNARKPLVGYSDATALLLWQRRCAGLAGFHGPMLERGDDVDPDVHESLVRQLLGRVELPQVLSGAGIHPGEAEGRLIGGNLALVVASLGTPWEIRPRGGILLLEEVGERPYRIDRMLDQLIAAGVLEGVVGLGLGELTACEDPRYPDPAALDVVARAIEPLGIPLVAGLPFGHVRRNHAWALGSRATIDGRRGEVRVLEQGVVRAT